MQKQTSHLISTDLISAVQFISGSKNMGVGGTPEKSSELLAQ